MPLLIITLRKKSNFKWLLSRICGVVHNLVNAPGRCMGITIVLSDHKAGNAGSFW